jgi:hypothetical protein
MIRGRSGPILISRGRVVTHAFDGDDRIRHFGHLPPPVGSADNYLADAVLAHHHRVDDDSFKTHGSAPFNFPQTIAFVCR